MKSTIISILFLVLSCQHALCQVIDTIDITKAKKNSFISIRLTGKNNGDSLELKLEKKLPIPFVVVIPKGNTIIEDKTIISEENIEIDLTNNNSNSKTFPQTGTRRMISGSVNYDFFLYNILLMIFSLVS